jgi:hypothetical protein
MVLGQCEQPVRLSQRFIRLFVGDEEAIDHEPIKEHCAE